MADRRGAKGDYQVRHDAFGTAPVVVVPERQGRPNQPSEDCPFCVGGLEAPEPYEVKAFPNRWPAMEGNRCEVILYSPDHLAGLGRMAPRQVEALIQLWSDRTAALGARADVAYVLIFENRGTAAGATIEHPHGQLYAYAEVPPVPAAERSDDDCPFCRADEAEELLVSRMSGWTTHTRAAAAWPYELLIRPQRHLGDLPEVAADPSERAGLAAVLGDAVARLDRLFSRPMPYMLWVHQRPTDGSRRPADHVHVHLCPLWRDAGVVRYLAGAEQGGGIFFNPVAPDRAAAALREA